MSSEPLLGARLGDDDTLLHATDEDKVPVVAKLGRESLLKVGVGVGAPGRLGQL